MKFKLTLLSLMGVMALNVSAQSEGAKTCGVAYEKGTSHNWFITFQGGVSMMMNGDNAKAELGDRIGITPSLSIGKWHSPYFATRLKVEGGEAKTFADLGATAGVLTLAQHKNYFVGGHYDFMLDLVNLFGTHGKNYFLHVNPFVGVGYEYKFDSSMKYNDVQAATANAGLQLACRLGKRVDFIVEGQATWNGMELTESYPVYFANNLRLGASAGLNFRLGKVGFEPARLMDEDAIRGLQSQINALRAENAELSKRPVKCPEILPAPVAEAKNFFLAEKSILFKNAAHQVSEDQLIHLFDASEFVKNLNGDLVVTGYAHKAESRIKGLAEKRAKEVAKLLTEKYGVPTQNITVEWKTDMPFADKAQTAWNRVVIIRSK